MLSKLWLARVSVFCVALAFATRSLMAQSPQAPGASESGAVSVDDQLHANDPKAVAWGAYRAGEGRLREAVPA
jgi:hypothetical protein